MYLILELVIGCPLATSNHDLIACDVCDEWPQLTMMPPSSY